MPSGDGGVTVQFGEDISLAVNRRVRRLRAAVAAQPPLGLLETVPTYRSLLVHYDPLITSWAEMVAALTRLLASVDALIDTPEADASGRRWVFPICFEGDDLAPDLGPVADWAGLDREDVIETLLSIEQIVYMIGFAPGQPYLGDLPESLAISRRKRPVMGVPAGSVVIADGKTVIYPFSNPTGWWIIGRTPARLFDVAAERPTLLTPGDRVRFERTSRAEFDALVARAHDRAWAPTPEATA